MDFKQKNAMIIFVFLDYAYFSVGDGLETV